MSGGIHRACGEGVLAPAGTNGGTIGGVSANGQYSVAPKFQVGFDGQSGHVGLNNRQSDLFDAFERKVQDVESVDEKETDEQPGSEKRKGTEVPQAKEKEDTGKKGGDVHEADMQKNAEEETNATCGAMKSARNSGK